MLHCYNKIHFHTEHIGEHILRPHAASFDKIQSHREHVSQQVLLASSQSTPSTLGENIPPCDVLGPGLLLCSLSKRYGMGSPMGTGASPHQTSRLAPAFIHFTSFTRGPCLICFTSITVCGDQGSFIFPFMSFTLQFQISHYNFTFTMCGDQGSFHAAGQKDMGWDRLRRGRARHRIRLQDVAPIHKQQSRAPGLQPLLDS